MIIRGNKKGGSGGGEDPNTLSTETVAKGLYLFSEGPVEGLSTDDGKSIYFNDVPLIDANDEVNFEGVTWTFRNGDPDQDWIPGFTSSVSTSAVGEQVTFSSPVVQTITGNYDAVNVIVSIPVLTYLNSSSGTLEGADLSYAIDVKTATGSYVTVYNVDLIKQKSTSEVQRIYRVDLPPGGSPWSVRLRRLTADSSDTNLQNDLYFGALATVVDGKFNYRNSCVLGIQLNAKQFQNSIPTVKAKIKGIKVWVPKNYDPITRTYATAGEGTSSGIWDGTFKAAWTNNPVWIYHDLLINNRYGLGEDFNPEDDPESAFVDKWSLYTIAQFCDEMVSDGYDGQEPRYSINTQITDKQEAYNLLQSIISSLNGMIYFSAEQIVAVADMPGEVDDVFTQADVIDGIFEYSGTALKTRHSVVLAYFNDPTNLYKKDQVVYEEYESITKLGYKPLEIEIFGCTSRAQAMRTAKWALHTEKSQTQTVTFKTGFRGGFLTPGNLIKIFDDYKAGERRGGRIISSSASGGSITFTLDQAVTLPSGSSIVYLNSNGEVQTKFLTGSYTNSSTVTAVATDLPVDGGVYGLISPDINGQLFRVLSVQENDVNEYTVIALEHDDTKYAIIDADQLFGDPQTSVYGNSRLSPVTNGSYQEWYEEISGSEVYPRVTLSWEKPNDARITGYELQLKTPTQDYYTVQDANLLTWDSPRLQADFDTNYGARVRAKDGLGRVSSWYYFVDFNVIGKDQAPGPPTNVQAEGFETTILVSWDNPTMKDFKHVEVWHGLSASDNPEEDGTRIANTPSDSFVYEGAGPGEEHHFWLRTVTHAELNNKSEFTEGVSASLTAPGVDTTPPGPPTSLVATGGFNSIWLEWYNPAASDLKGVEIYQNTVNDSSTATKIATAGSTPVGHGSFLVGGLANNVTRYYWVKAIDQSGNLSEFSNEAHATTITIDPADLGTAVAFNAPTGLGTSSALVVDTDGSQVVTLTATWSAIVDARFQYYEVAVSEAGGSFVEVPVAGTTYSFKGRANTSYSVKVRGVDKNGNRTNYTTLSTLTSTVDTAAPSAPSSITGTAGISNVFLKWTNPTVNDLDKIEVWHATSNSSGAATKIGTVNALSGGPGAFSHTGLTTGSTNYYFLKALDTSGNASGFSASGGPFTPVQVGAADIVANSITASQIQAGSITGDRFDTATSLPGTITVGSTGVSIGTVKTTAESAASTATTANGTANTANSTANSALTLANAPAATINAGSTTIDPGKILISGSTTLSSWRDGTDNTKIAGGNIAANSVSANKLYIGNRGVDVIDLVFEHNTTSQGSGTTTANSFAWSSGLISYTRNDGTHNAIAVGAGTAAFYGSTVYAYWQTDSSSIQTTTDPSTAYGPTCIVLATYAGGVALNATYGRTIIDGSGIKTNSVTANQIQALTITGGLIAADAITAPKIHAGELSFTHIVGGGLTDLFTGQAGGSTALTTSLTDTGFSCSFTSGDDDNCMITAFIYLVNTGGTSSPVNVNLIRKVGGTSTTIAQFGEYLQAASIQWVNFTQSDTPPANSSIEYRLSISSDASMSGATWGDRKIMVLRSRR